MSRQKYVPSKICPVEKVAVDNMSVEKMSRCHILTILSYPCVYHYLYCIDSQQKAHVIVLSQYLGTYRYLGYKTAMPFALVPDLGKDNFKFTICFF